MLNEIKYYLVKKYAIDPSKIQHHSTLLYDLGFKGKDVDKFFSALIKDYKINVKRLNLSRFYTGDEPFDFINPLLRFVKCEKAKQKPVLTIGDIERFIQTGILE